MELRDLFSNSISLIQSNKVDTRGDFVIEIPIESNALVQGKNQCFAPRGGGQGEIIHSSMSHKNRFNALNLTKNFRESKKPGSRGFQIFDFRGALVWPLAHLCM